MIVEGMLTAGIQRRIVVDVVVVVFKGAVVRLRRRCNHRHRRHAVRRRRTYLLAVHRPDAAGGCRHWSVRTWTMTGLLAERSDRRADIMSVSSPEHVQACLHCRA